MKKYISESIEIQNRVLADSGILDTLETVISKVGECFQKSGKIMLAGNGGSAADCQHFAAEIVGRFKKERKGYPAIALTTDTSILTAWANDYCFETIFSRQIKSLGRKGDIFFGISTSGNSKNIIRAVEVAKEKEITTVCLLGKGGGKLEKHADYSIVVPSDNTPRIQEVHLLLIHIICEEIEINFI